MVNKVIINDSCPKEFQYEDDLGQPISLEGLCRLDPGWAASIIKYMKHDVYMAVAELHVVCTGNVTGEIAGALLQEMEKALGKWVEED